MKHLLIITLFSSLLLSAEVIAKEKDKGKNINYGQVNSTIKKATTPGNASVLNKGKKNKLEKSITKSTKKVIKEVTR